nr:glycoside hydrolase [Crateriforma spongiae]
MLFRLSLACWMFGALLLCWSASPCMGQSQAFPHKMPSTKPDIPLSTASQRLFEYPAPLLQDNPLYTQFKYTPLQGLDYHDGDGTVTRRDPSRPILADGKYHIWYTKRDTVVPPIGAANAEQATDEIPSTDWDLCEIWHATSVDGFTWEEQAVAVPRPPKPQPGWRSVATPDILVWKGRYYLYYQAFIEPSGLKGDWCAVSVSHADSPDGPWTHTYQNVVPTGPKGTWDQDAVHDPMPIVYRGKIHIYYKAAFNKWPDERKRYAVGHGLVTSDDPLGPFQRCPLNPVLHSGHETTYFPFKDGVAALSIKDGNERSTMQWSPDGINFEIASVVDMPPVACAPFTPDAFTDTDDGRGITWGLCHFINAGTAGKRHSILARFDCDLSLDVDDPWMRGNKIWFKPEVYFSQGLNKAQRQRIEQANAAAAASSAPSTE